MQLTYNIITSPQQRGSTYTVNIDGYRFLEELWEELRTYGIIDRLTDIPQLGNIPVKSKLRKSRYDYVMLQMYLHQFVRKQLNGKLKYSYNNFLKKEDLLIDENLFMICDGKKFLPSVGDAMQVLALIYNIGHFYNTFTASMATLNAINTKSEVKRNFLAMFPEGTDCLVDDIISTGNYHRFHLVNSLMILEKCDQKKASIILAKKLIFLYINHNLCTEKMKYVFDIFKDIRTFSYIIYDLPVSKAPLYLDIRDTEALKVIMSELLDQFNNKKALHTLMKSIDKILDDTVYNEKARAIISYQIAKRMEKELLSSTWSADDYFQLFFNRASILNRSYPQNKQFDKQNILKITFYPDDAVNWRELLDRLDRKNNVKVGYYHRISSGGKTILVSIKSSCTQASKKTQTSFKIIKEFLSAMNHSKTILPSDPRYITLVKYFLHYLLGECPVKILPTVDKTKCVLLKRGKSARVKEITQLLASKYGNRDSRHEVEFIQTVLKLENTNDVCLMVCGSIVVYQKDCSGKKLNEYDGLIVFPNRTQDQIIFVEAKNTKESAQAITCLKSKLKHTPIICIPENIQKIGNDCYLKISI